MAELMTVEEIAQYLRVTTKTIYRLLKKGSIPTSKVGHLWRFDKGTIDTWLKENATPLKTSILVIDDEESIRSLFEDVLMSLGHKVMTAETSSRALALIKAHNFDLVFLDLKMPDIDGAELLGQIKALKPDLLVAIITAYADSELMTRALEQGPLGVMKKPFTVSDIKTAIDTFLTVCKTKE
jgi:excisionase family DNA binding protein